MFKYEYICPKTINEACEILSLYKDSARIIAGGTDLIVQIRDEDKRWENIKYVIDINHIEQLNNIEEDEEFIRIGAIVTHSEIEKSEILRRNVPFLSEAASTVGAPQIRNRGTVGGNICNASPAADTVPALVALNAEVKIESIKGSRIVPLKSIYDKPNVNNLSSDEILTEIRFKKLDEGSKTAFIKLGRRKALAISRINIAFILRTDEENYVREARIVPGCIFPTPDRVNSAEDLMIGRILTEELIEEAGEKVSEEMIKRTGIRWSTEYKKPVIEALTRRVIKQAKEGK